MPQLNLVIIDMSFSSMCVFLVVTDIIILINEVDDQLLSYNNYILLNTYNREKVPERLNGLDCKSNDFVFVGSNPILFNFFQA